MRYNLKRELEKHPRLASGHRLCAGCGAGVAVNGVLRALDEGDRAVVSNATSCLEVSTFMYPYTAYEDSYIHSAFENAAAMTGGVEAAYQVLKRKGKIDETYKFICFGGDGGTYDIGFQSLSGAMERGHDMVYVCYDNEAYMNTGTQRSSATPRFADATTTPVGSQSYGKVQNKKNLTEIIAAHNVPYAAQTTMIGDFSDLHTKAHKAIYTEGPCFLNVLSPCPRGWGYNMEDLAEICKLAVMTCVWPLYEVENGVWRLNFEPAKKLPVERFLEKQNRFRHMFVKGNEWMIDEAQAYVDGQWEKLKKRCQEEAGVGWME
ncbi:MAG: pyruvate ferredoxin oxidoreductase [Firmicutes bacterium]|nr:pyruvate ferredoxin oxidoreductase [Bacillota bacterium]